MSKSVKIEGIILRKRVLKESDTSLVIFSRSLGKLWVTAKGVRQITSKRAGHLQTGSYISCICRQSLGGLYIQQSTLISALYSIKHDPPRLEAFTLSIFLLDRLLPDSLPELEIYISFQLFIKKLASVSSEQVHDLFVLFVIKLLSDLGHHDGSILAWSECRELCEKIIEEKLPSVS
ncbi:MAG: DNA repair protein RecO [Candidatus Roizmanbacteria bacterium]